MVDLAVRDNPMFPIDKTEAVVVMHVTEHLAGRWDDDIPVIPPIVRAGQSCNQHDCQSATLLGPLHSTYPDPLTVYIHKPGSMSLVHQYTVRACK